MWSVFTVFLRLGLTSFGGPIAHLGFFRQEFVERRRWMSDRTYADLVALCQFLPGPASSQVGMAVGFYQASYKGALAAWLGFTLPSAMLMILFALGLSNYPQILTAEVLQGLKLVALAVVAQAIWSMAISLCNTATKLALMSGAALLLIISPGVLMQLLVIILGGVIGVGLFRNQAGSPEEQSSASHGSLLAIVLLAIFLVLLLVLPLLAKYSSSSFIGLFDVFYRVGSLVFGGGHVVLPLLQAELVPSEIVATDQFLAGYGAAQVVPGPLFSFAAFLGAIALNVNNSLLGGVVCLVAIFLPSFLLVFGVLPFWDRVRRFGKVQAALIGVNAAVVGILIAAFYQPIWLSTIHVPLDFGLALLAFVALQFFKLPPWLVVLGGGFGGLLVGFF